MMESITKDNRSLKCLNNYLSYNGFRWVEGQWATDEMIPCLFGTWSSPHLSLGTKITLWNSWKVTPIDWELQVSTSIYVTLWNVSLKDKYKQRKSDGPHCFIAVVKLKQWWPCSDIPCMRPPSQDKRDMWGEVLSFCRVKCLVACPVLLHMCLRHDYLWG